MRQNFPSEYHSWSSMKTRCYNPKRKQYKDWGGRGIRVCERWINSFQNFISDMGPKPGPEYSLERIDNDGDYEPGNCKWATFSEQVQNSRSAKLTQSDVKKIRELYFHSGENYTFASLGAKFHVSYQQISLIIHNKSWMKREYAGEDLFKSLGILK